MSSLSCGADRVMALVTAEVPSVSLWHAIDCVKVLRLPWVTQNFVEAPHSPWWQLSDTSWVHSGSLVGLGHVGVIKECSYRTVTVTHILHIP